MTSNTQPGRTAMSLEDAVEHVQDRPIPASGLTTVNHPCCSFCKQPATGNCPRCYNMWYCSQNCVRDDRNIHRGFCASFAYMKTSPQQANEAYFCSVYLPAQDHLPQFVWLEYASPGTMSQPDPVQMGELMEGTYAAYAKFNCHRQPLNHQIEIFYGTRLVGDDSDTNKSLAHLLPGTSANHWKGSLLACGVDFQTGSPVDLDTNAVPAILDFLALASMHRSMYPEKAQSPNGDMLVESGIVANRGLVGRDAAVLILDVKGQGSQWRSEMMDGGPMGGTF